MGETLEWLDAVRRGISRSLTVSGHADQSDMKAWLEDLDAILAELRSVGKAEELPANRNNGLPDGWIDAGEWEGAHIGSGWGIVPSVPGPGVYRVWLDPLDEEAQDG